MNELFLLPDIDRIYERQDRIIIEAVDPGQIDRESINLQGRFRGHENSEVDTMRYREPEFVSRIIKNHFSVLPSVNLISKVY